MRFPNAIISAPPAPLYNYDDYVKVKRRDTQLVFQRVKEHLSKATDDFTRLQNARAKPTRIGPGSLVMILNQRRDGPMYKLTEKFLGPYRVLEHITGNKYKLENLATGEQVHEHLNHMKLARLTVEDDTPTPVPDNVLCDPTTVTPTSVSDMPSDTTPPHVFRRWSYSWLQHLRHQVTGEGRSAGVQVAVGVDTLDYGYEYMGVASASVHTPTTLRARHSLLTAAIRHKCGAAVGGVGGGKTETLTSLARAAGHHLATLTCTSYTPAQSLQSVVSGCVQGGYWLLLEDAHRLTPSALSRLAQYLHNVHYTKAHALKRCVIDGQEMKLVDSFSVFMTVTQEHSHATTSPDQAPSPCSLLNHPVTPHITSVTVCPPTTETLLEAVLLGRGFAVSSDYLQKARECFTQLGFLLPGTAPPALSRLVQATARVCCDIRSAVRGPSGITTDVAILRPNRLGHSGTTNVTGAEITQLKPVPGGESKSGADGKNLKETITDTAKPSSATSVRLQLPRSSQQLTDQEIVTQALYAVLTPLLSSRELEWHRVFTNIFDIEETVDNEGSSEDSEIEESVREVLLEWGYGSQEYLESRDNLEPGKGLISDINVGYFNKAHADKGNGCYDQVEITDVEESNGPGEQKSGTDRERIAKLSSHGASLLKAALHMYSILAIHHCCCITAPSGAGKSTVWKVLAESLNRLWRKESCESPQSSWRVSWRVLQCGAFTRSHLLGSWHDDGRVWRRGVLFTTLTEAQQCAGERWVVLVGPFLPSLQAALAPLCQPSPVFKDEALHQVFLGPHVRIILELNHEEDLTPQVRASGSRRGLQQSLHKADYIYGESVTNPAPHPPNWTAASHVLCPVLVLKSEAMGVEAAAGEAVRRLARSIPLLRRPQEAAEARSTLAQGLLNLHLPPTSLAGFKELPRLLQ
nr:uncharacterized protein LOC123757045 [Procambarus clarkii]